jgi:hypothetical protein
MAITFAIFIRFEVLSSRYLSFMRQWYFLDKWQKCTPHKRMTDTLLIIPTNYLRNFTLKVVFSEQVKYRW